MRAQWFRALYERVRSYSSIQIRGDGAAMALEMLESSKCFVNGIRRCPKITPSVPRRRKTTEA